MPQVGFICPKNKMKVPFSACYDCADRCMELPILLALMEQREKVDNVFSVTELQKPPRIAAWERLNDYYLDPFSQVFALFGTAFHAVIEKQTGKLINLGKYIPSAGRESYSVENDNYFEREITVGDEKVVLRGTPDQYEWQSGTLIDHKSLKYYYDVQYMLEKPESWDNNNYRWQLNIYRRLKFPDCKFMALSVLVKDWNRRLRDKTGVAPLVRIPVPWIDDDLVDAHIQASLTGILSAVKDISAARDCSEDEMWSGGIRCRESCSVSEAGECPQYSREEETPARSAARNAARVVVRNATKAANKAEWAAFAAGIAARDTEAATQDAARIAIKAIENVKDAVRAEARLSCDVEPDEAVSVRHREEKT